MISMLADWPRWALMWLVAAVIYFGCKLLTWRVADTERVPLWRQSAYLFAWPGMNAARFFAADEASRPEPPAPSEWGRGALNLLAGAAIFWGAQFWVGHSSPVLLGWAGMIGIILMLHFGSFHLLSCFWRWTGIDAPPLMNTPTHSTSIAEFWGRRWNIAFRDLTYQFLFRPLGRRLGTVPALVIGFVVSGIVHDVVISLPAGSGHGGPTCFFAIQPVALLVERSALGRSLGLGKGVRGWLFTALVLLGPARLLFHDPFVMRIVVPVMEALGAG